MKKVILLITLAMCKLTILAQEITKQERGYFNVTELGYFTVNNTFESQIGSNSFKVVYDGAYGLSLRNINGLFITNKISLGLGLGLENYTLSSDDNSWDNTFQVFLDARYYFKNGNNTFFAYGDLGSSVSISDNIAKGPMFNLGVGYKLKSSEKTALVGSIGFIDQTIKEQLPVLRNRYYGVAFKIGLLL